MPEFSDVAKTSESDPLRIQVVEIRDGYGIIGLTFCPGKKHHGLYSGAWDRDLCLDLEAIRAFGAKALVTLMPGEELSQVGVSIGSLGEHAAELGLEWHHLPIRDVDVPGERFEDLWIYSGMRLRRILARSDKIVVHCLGGLGRTGTIAGRLLVEFGDLPEAAIKKIRDSRPGSIETPAQEGYVKNCRPVVLARVLRSGEERALASLVGGAIGDALGYEVEFKSLSAIRERFGQGGIKTPVLHHGSLVVSDDTQMTLFTLEGLLRSLTNKAAPEESVIPSIQNAYLDWFDTQCYASRSKGNNVFGWLAQQQVMRTSRAPGNTCLSALHSGGNGTINKPINDSKGCGGVMRVAPIGLLDPEWEPQHVFQIEAESAALTHGHPSGYLSAGMLASILHMLTDGTHLDSVIDRSSQILTAYQGNEETLAAVRKATKLAAESSRDHAVAVESLGSGWVGEEALAIALYAVSSANSFVEAVSIAANHSGDSDSTASIAGQLWGAMEGLGGMPHDWIMRLDVLAPLLHLAGQFIPYGLPVRREL